MAQGPDTLFNFVHWRMKSLLVSALLTATITPTVAQPDVFKCTAEKITVTADDEILAQRVCSVVSRASPQLEACHLGQLPAVEIAVVKHMPLLHSNCFGIYDCDNQQIKVLEPAYISLAADPNNAFLELAPDMLFDSVIVHELTHAYTSQSATNTSLSLAASEYIAYAMQLEFLPAIERQKVLDAHEFLEPVEPEGLNGFVLMMAPSVFAAKAWRHFKYAGNGCEFVLDIIDGEVDLDIEVD